MARGRTDETRNTIHTIVPLMNDSTTPHRPASSRHWRTGGFRQDGIDAGTCRRFRDDYNIAAVTNDIYTKEDAQFRWTTCTFGGPHHRR